MEYVNTVSQLIPILALALVIELRYLMTMKNHEALRSHGLAFSFGFLALIPMGISEIVLIDSLRVGHLTKDIRLMATAGMVFAVVVLVFSPLDAIYKYISQSKKELSKKS